VIQFHQPIGTNVLVLVLWLFQFHKHKYAQLSQNTQLEVLPNFSALGSTLCASDQRKTAVIKYACKWMMKLTPVVIFIKILQAAFATNILLPKNYKAKL